MEWWSQQKWNDDPNKHGMMIPTQMEWWSQQKWNDDTNTNGMMIPTTMEWWSQQTLNDYPNTNGMMIPTKMEWWSQQKRNDDPNKKGMMVPRKMEWWSPKKLNDDPNKNGMMVPTNMEWWSQHKWNDDPNKNGMMIATNIEWWYQHKWNDDPNKHGMMIPTQDGMMIPTTMEWWSQQTWNDDPNTNGMMTPNWFVFFSHPSINRGLQSVHVVHRFFVTRSFLWYLWRMGQVGRSLQPHLWRFYTSETILFFWTTSFRIIPILTYLDPDRPRPRFSSLMLLFGLESLRTQNLMKKRISLTFHGGFHRVRPQATCRRCCIQATCRCWRDLATRSYKPKSWLVVSLEKECVILYLGWEFYSNSHSIPKKDRRVMHHHFSGNCYFTFSGRLLWLPFIEERWAEVPHISLEHFRASVTRMSKAHCMAAGAFTRWKWWLDNSGKLDLWHWRTSTFFQIWHV